MRKFSRILAIFKVDKKIFGHYFSQNINVFDKDFFLLDKFQSKID